MHLAKVSLLLLSTVLVVDAKRVTKNDAMTSLAADDAEKKNDTLNSIFSAEGGAKATCFIHGDPHIRTFDGGKEFHPMHAPGHWWLVHGKNDALSIQATYGGCGMKSGGWMSKRLDGVPRTCLTGLAIGGRLLNTGKAINATGGGNTLIIRPPCEWDWDNSRCTNTDTRARITWNGDAVGSLDLADPEVKVTYAGNQIDVKLPHDIEVKLHLGGSWGGAHRESYMNTHITMPALPPGSICGHCGNFNGIAGDDQMYKYTGLLKDSTADSLCDASVHCQDRLMKDVQFGSYTAKESYECEENKEGVDFDISDCPAEILEGARQRCTEAFGVLKGGAGNLDELMEDCLMDECLGEGFAKDDADDALQEEGPPLMKARH